MKLATALTERSDLQRRIAELSKRLVNNAKVQEGDVPAESPEALLKELDAAMARLEELMARINLTNSLTVYGGAAATERLAGTESGEERPMGSGGASGDKTMTELLAHRDCLMQKLRIMREFLNAASSKIDRYSKAEIKILSTVPVAEIQKDVDALSKELRETNEWIQELNWTTELR